MTYNTLITGPTNGIGRETALALAKQGHRLFLLCRNRDLGEALVSEIAAIEGAPAASLLLADLGNMQQVRDVAETFLASSEPLHLLINNAGLVNTERKLVDVNGHEQEQMFAVNHLGHFLLTYLLLPRLIETGRAEAMPARVVVVSSEAHALFTKGLDFDDMSFSQSFSGLKAYGRSKLANLLMVHELVKKVSADEVQINSLHPGAVNSNLGANNQHHWYTPLIKGFLGLFFISPEKGANTSLHLATAAIDTQGVYYYRCKPHRIKPWGKDDTAAQKLWDYSVKLLALESL